MGSWYHGWGGFDAHWVPVHNSKGFRICPMERVEVNLLTSRAFKHVEAIEFKGGKP